ncbi:MAG TPA: hypothetical protein VEK08_22570 [Planctomycetota bacterium]|nr:hypothetical protein [Planctomycetota bacterium]
MTTNTLEGNTAVLELAPLGSEPLSKEHAISAQAAENLERSLDAGDGRLHPRDAAVELLHEFTVIARAMWPQDKSIQDDLVQEMALAAIHCREPHTPSFYCSLGAWRARDYLRWWLIPIYKRQGLDPDAVLKRIDASVKPIVAQAQNAVENR